MADNLIQVGVKFDGSQLQAGMHEATAAVSQAANEMKVDAGYGEAHPGAKSQSHPRSCQRVGL